MSLLQDVQGIAEEEGYVSASQWVADRLINRGWTFEQLAQYIALNYKRYYSWQHIYGVCRPLLPGALLPARLRKYNLLAKRLGYSNAMIMFREAIKKQKSCVDMAILLKKYPSQIVNLLQIADVRRVLKKRIRRKKKSKQGFFQPAAQLRWEKKANFLGYKSIRQMLTKYPGTDKQLARQIGVTEQTICLIKKRVF